MATDTEVVDLRTMALEAQADRATTVFDDLEPGATVVLVTDGDAKPLLARLQDARPGWVEWFLLEGGPPRTRVVVRRRAKAAPRGVSEFLGLDHHRLDEILEAVDQLCRQNAWSEAATRFDEFACGLNGHIDAEEQVQFPHFEAVTGMTTGPTTVMRAEHVRIRQHMAELRLALGAAEPDVCRQVLAGLVDVLSSHNLKEEHVLYPMTDRLSASADDRDALVQAIQRA